MTLRTRLLIGYALIVLLLVLTGGAGAFGFREISGIVDQRLDRYARSTRRAQTLVDSIERQDAALLRALLRIDPPAARSDMDAADRAFDNALRDAADDPDPDTAQLVAAVGEAFPAYRSARELAFAAFADGDNRYASDVAPAYEVLHSAAARLYATTSDHTVQARAAVRAATVNASVLLGVLVTGGLLLLVALARSMRTHVLERLDELRRFSDAIAQGDIHQRASLGGADELGQMSTQMNAMLDRQAALESRLEGRLVHDRELLVALLATRRRGALILGPSGDLIAWSGPLPDPRRFDALAVALTERNRERVANPDSEAAPFAWTDPAGAELRVQLLRTPSGRAIGWLAEPSA